eukprot:3723211-Karenia_brevis.AAC.1
MGVLAISPPLFAKKSSKISPGLNVPLCSHAYHWAPMLLATASDPTAVARPKVYTPHLSL